MSVETDTSPYVQGTAPSSPTKKVINDEAINYESTAAEPPVFVTCPSKEVNARRFIERDYYAIDSKFEYPRNGNDPGLVLIFNQENVPNFKPRKGCKRDINEIVTTLQRQGFNIDENDIMIDYTSKEILAKLEKVSKMDLSQQNCLIIFFLSHGNELERLYTYDGHINTWEVWSKFVDCKYLQNKPKMFVFQACKGDNYTTTTNSSQQSSTLPSPITPYKIFTTDHVGPDMLIVYSTIEGNVSFRDRTTGSWFIQELCKNITAYGKRDDVISLIIRTTKCVCGNYFNFEDEVVKKQMPMFVSTLSKKFYLNRNKDRDLLIRMVESNEEILRTLKNIKDVVDKMYVRGSEREKK